MHVSYFMLLVEDCFSVTQEKPQPKKAGWDLLGRQSQFNLWDYCLLWMTLFTTLPSTGVSFSSFWKKGMRRWHLIITLTIFQKIGRYTAEPSTFLNPKSENSSCSFFLLISFFMDTSQMPRNCFPVCWAFLSFSGVWHSAHFCHVTACWLPV